MTPTAGPLTAAAPPTPTDRPQEPPPLQAIPHRATAKVIIFSFEFSSAWLLLFCAAGSVLLVLIDRSLRSGPCVFMFVSDFDRVLSVVFNRRRSGAWLSSV